jgi:UDP-glucose:(glucosyl)LPS alpha-1,2-glucosyltransferase
MTESWRNELNMNSNSGSELMMKGLIRELGEDFLDDFQIILSRPRELDESKIRIFWAHDLPEDPESVTALKHDGWKKFHRFVFVSHWQQQRYIEHFNIPWSRTVVLRNAITPIDVDVDAKFKLDADEPIRVIYHTTPHRGLGLLVPAFEQLAQEIPNLHLDVYSSFNIYGWGDSDEKFQPLFDRIIENENMTYHGTVSNDEVREALTKAHIFAYPSVWTETSCLALIEAMNAGCLCIHPNNGALYETSAGWTFMYPFHEEPSVHAGQMHDALRSGVDLVRRQDEGLGIKLHTQKSYTDVNYSWEIRKHEWTGYLNSLRELPREFETEHSGDTWSYNVGI